MGSILAGGTKNIFGGVYMKTFNKLVRDRIPEIICKNGETPTIRILCDQEYERELNKKLLEEVREYLDGGNIEELADIEEVLRAIVELKGRSYQEFDGIREAKCEKRGAFKNRLFLESTN